MNKKIIGGGYPDGKAVKTGAPQIKYHLDYMAWSARSTGGGLRATR